MSNRSTARRQSTRVAFCAMAAALSAALMLLGGVIPIATYAVPMLCGLILLPVLLEFDAPAAWATFLGTALIALLLGFDKEAAFFYLFLGYYPIIKWKIDKIGAKPLRLLMKILFFSLSLVLMYALLALLFPVDQVLGEFREMGYVLTAAFGLVFVGCMLLYDAFLPRMVMLYANRIRPKWKFLKR